jgi:magnesium transporter
MTSTACTVVEFDFESRKERTISADDARAACDGGRCCWIDVLLDDPQQAEVLLKQMGVNPVAIEAVLTEPMGGRCDVYEDCLHTAVSAPRFEDGHLRFSYVDMILGERYIITVRRARVEFIEQSRKNYQHFFQRFAQSLGFLLFEFWDQLVDSYRKALLKLEDEVGTVQANILGEMDDRIFGRVAEVTHHLLLLRKSILADREVLEQLAVRKSTFVASTTQPYLANMVGTLERLGSDLTVEREILAETLHLYLGVVSHRTNRVVNRLTMISAIFLPLTFLCGVYGMNFTYLPEKDWDYGYLFFWLLAAGIAGGLLALFRLRRWL